MPTVAYGILVAGLPGSGKSHLCSALEQMGKLLERDVRVINLDPASDSLPYEPAVDIRDLITVEDVMEVHGLGPNGAMMYCIDFLCKNISWLVERVCCNGTAQTFYVIDLPGQAEVYTVSASFGTIVHVLGDYIRLLSIHALDSSLLTDLTKYISGAVAGLMCFASLGVGMINVLTKVDLLKELKPAVPLTSLVAGDGDGDMPSSIHQAINALCTLPGMKRWRGLCDALCHVLDGANTLGSTAPYCCSVYDGELVGKLWDQIDSMLGIGVFVGDIAVGRTREYLEELEDADAKYVGERRTLFDFAEEWDYV